MKRYTHEELQQVLADHKKWVLDEDGGHPADLRCADLRCADLRCADLRGADLQGANLQGAYLQGAYLRGADLQGAYLQGAYLQGANLRCADLRCADLRCADLRCADLQGAHLWGADLRGAHFWDMKIRSATVFTGLYAYLAMPVIAEDGTEYVRLGCHFHKVSEWEENFWNNDQDFPNDGSAKSQERLMAYRTCLEWLRIHREAAKEEGAK